MKKTISIITLFITSVILCSPCIAELKDGYGIKYPAPNQKHPIKGSSEVVF